MSDLNGKVERTVTLKAFLAFSSSAVDALAVSVFCLDLNRTFGVVESEERRGFDCDLEFGQNVSVHFECQGLLKLRT